MGDTPVNPPEMIQLTLRFYGILNDFLTPGRKGKRFVFCVKGRPSIKDTIEALGVPHPEVGRIIAGGRVVDFSFQLGSGETIRVFPADFFSRRRQDQILRKKISRKKKFVLDSHLGKLVRHLRILGFDCVYEKIFPDDEIAATAARQKRIVLTRDLGLLKNKKVEFGYWVRSPDPKKQLADVVKRFRLFIGARPFSLCLECNGKIRVISKEKILAQLPLKACQFYRRFYICRSCRKIYWKGSHHAQLLRVIRRARRLRQSG